MCQRRRDVCRRERKNVSYACVFLFFVPRDSACNGLLSDLEDRGHPSERSSLVLSAARKAAPT